MMVSGGTIFVKLDNYSHVKTAHKYRSLFFNNPS
jgi:hypothetical protein